jgi:hypothetical protein
MSRLRPESTSVNQLDEFAGSQVRGEARCPECTGELELVPARSSGEALIWCDLCEEDVTAELQQKMGFVSSVRFAAEHRLRLDRFARMVTRVGDDRAAIRTVVELAVLNAPLTLLETDWSGNLGHALTLHIHGAIQNWRAVNSRPAMGRRRQLA